MSTEPTPAAFPWPLRAVSAVADLADTLKALADAERKLADQCALNISLSRSLQAANEELAALRAPRPPAPTFARNPEVMTIPGGAMPVVLEAHYPLTATATAGPLTYKPTCRTCKSTFESPGPNAKKCPKCKAAETAPAKPPRPGLASNATKAAPKKPAKPAPELDDDEAPIVKERPRIACAGCAHAKLNRESETGFECRKPTPNGPGAYSSCKPWTFAHHYTTNFAPTETK